MLDPSLPDSLRALRAEDFWDGLDKPFDGNIIEIKIYIRGFEHSKSAKSILADCVVEAKPLTAVLTYQFRPRKGIDVKSPVESNYEYVVFGGSDEKNRVAANIREWLALTVLPALRDAETDMQSWRKSPLRPLLDRARKSIDLDKLIEVRSALDAATETLLKQPAITKLANELNKGIRELVGPVHSVETQFDFASSEPEQLMRSIRLFLNEKQTRALTEASLGTANILFLALLLQDLDIRQEARELVSTILAIEEPEAHLHPHLQRLLFRHFLRRGHSVIVTTHSPNIASVAPVKSLVLLRTTAAGSKGFTSRKLKLTASEADDLQRYLDVTRAEMLFARGVIFVEGPAEQFVVPAFAMSLLAKSSVARSLDELGISVCSVNGTDFHPFSKLLSDAGLSIPYVIITDGDPLDSNKGGPYAGLRRGIRLIEDEDTRREIERLVEAKKYENATNQLAAEGVFVGDHTLEIDLLEELADEMKETYAELRDSEKASKNFEKAVHSALEGAVEAIADLLARIEKVGKGRFAQRLSSKIDNHPPPSYIGEAIDHIVSLVGQKNARSSERIRTAK